MELLLKIAAGAVTAALCAMMLRRNAGEFAVLILLAAGVWILAMSAQAITDVVSALSRLARVAQLENELVKPVIKVVGLSVITRVAGETCRAAGEGGIAAFVEVSGTVLALAASVPLVMGVVELLAEMLI